MGNIALNLATESSESDEEWELVKELSWTLALLSVSGLLVDAFISCGKDKESQQIGMEILVAKFATFI